MYRYHYRLRVFLLSLGVVLGYGSAIAHVAWHRHDHCAWAWDQAPWQSHMDNPAHPAQNGAPAPKPVQ